MVRSRFNTILLLASTTDGGDNWHPVTDFQITSSSIGAVAVRRNRPRPRLHRHRRNLHPRQHPARRRRLPQPRRGHHLGAHRLPRLAGHLQDPHPPDRSGHCLRRVVRRVRGAGRGAGRLSFDRRRRQQGAHPLPRRAHRRDRHRDRPQQPGRSLRVALGGLPQGVHDVVRRPRQRHVQVDRRRRQLDRDHAEPRHAGRGRRRAHRGGCLERELEPCLLPLRARGRRALPVGRRRRDLAPRGRNPPGIRAAMHPGWTASLCVAPRANSGCYSPLVAPCQPGASPVSVLVRPCPRAATRRSSRSGPARWIST